MASIVNSMETPRVSPQVPDETVIEMLKFINIQHEDYKKLWTTPCKMDEVNNSMHRLFKKSLPDTDQDSSAENKNAVSSEANQIEINKKKLTESTGSNPKEENDKPFKNIEEMQKFVTNKLSSPKTDSEIYQIVEDIIKSSIINTKSDFYILMIESTFAVLKFHNLKLEFLDSSSKREIYVRVIASEETIIDNAMKMHYKLKLKKKLEWVNDFQKHSLYIPIHYIKKHQLNRTFVNYDQIDKEVDDGRILTFNDKYIIINSLLAENIDLSVLMSKDIMLDRFILHQKVPIKKLSKKWAGFSNFLKPMPSNLIKTYFSEQIAFYFNFLDLLKDFIKVLAILGLIIYSLRIINYYFIKSHQIIILYHFYSVFLIIWGLTFNKVFQRKEKILAWKWGTLNCSHDQIQRQEFKGKYKKDEVTNKMKIINENTVRYFFIKVASFIGSGSFMILGILCNSQIPLLFQYLTGVKYASEVYANSQIYQLLGGIMFGIQINVFNISYNFIARKLTDAENHETIHEHNNSLILKLFIFRFVNSYWNLFEIAFLKDKEKCQNKSCMTELGYRLMIIFSTCLVFNFIEIGLPWVKYWFRILITYKTFSLKNLKKKDEDFEIKLESLLEPYDNTINDYMEIFTMFGYIALFGASHHLIGILALIALFLESRIDSLKLCTIIRRPEPIKSKSIGVWKQLFLFVSLCGIFTNTAISIFTTGLINDIDPRYKVLLFIFVENSMFLVAAVMWTMVSPVPDVIIRSTNWAKRISHEIEYEKNPYTKSFWSRSRFVKKSDFQFDLNRRRANTIQH